MLKSHDRFPYSPIIKRPNFTWPNGKRLAVHVCLNLEHFSYGEGLGISYSPRIPHPNTYNWGWREYGNRVGVWRLIELFDHLHLPVSLLLNSEIYDHCPEVVAEFRARGDEVVGHGRTNSEHQNDFDEAGETQLIRDVTEAITRHEGKPPQGWLSPGVNPSARTPDLLQEAGYTYILDWPMDDQPVWIRTRRGRLLAMPYPHEINDVPDAGTVRSATSGVRNFAACLHRRTAVSAEALAPRAAGGRKTQRQGLAGDDRHHRRSLCQPSVT
jgi:allantoinase